MKNFILAATAVFAAVLTQVASELIAVTESGQVRMGYNVENEYAGFADSWKYRWTYQDSGEGHDTCGFTGLTTIEGREYAVFQSVAQNGDFTRSIGEEYIRQSDGIVYTYIYESTGISSERKGKEHILWDFNLEPGDEIESIYDYLPSQKIINKWTVDIDGPKRALQICVGSYSERHSYTVVEGIGAIEYGTMATYGLRYWKTGSAMAKTPSLSGDYYLFLASVSDGEGNLIFERGKTLTDYSPIISEDKVWEYGVGSGNSMNVERMAFRGTRTVNDVEYHCFGTLYSGPRSVRKVTESDVAFNPYLLREEYGKVYLLHTPGSCHLEDDSEETPVESLLYDFTVTDGSTLDVLAGGAIEQGTVSIHTPIEYQDIECKNYTLWDGGPVFMECLGVLSGGNLAEFSKECTSTTSTLRYVYNAKGDILYSAPEVPKYELKGNEWTYRSYMPGKYAEFSMLFSRVPREIDGKHYYPFYTASDKLYTIFGDSPILSSGETEDIDRFLIRQDGGRILMRVPDEKVWPFLTVEEGVREVCLYDYELEEGESYDMFTTSGAIKATLLSTSTEKVFGKDRLLQVFELEGGKIVEVVEGLGNVTRGTYATIEPDGAGAGNPEGLTPADMLNPTEGYPAFLLKVYDYLDDMTYSNENRFLASIESINLATDGFTAPSDRIYDLQGRELREPVAGQPYIKGGKVYVEK